MDSNKNGTLDPEEQLSAKHSLICGNKVVDFSWVDLRPSDKHLVPSAVIGNAPGQVNIQIEKGSADLQFIGLNIARKEGDEATADSNS